MNKPKAIIFDIDGTLADPTHRRHFVQTKPANWGAFNSLMGEDEPIKQVISVLDMYVSHSCMNIFLLSGREATERNVMITESWVASNTSFNAVHGNNLFMRKEKDYRPDEEVKLELLKEFIEPFYDVFFIVDDRPKVVKMWRENGFFVFDVNQSGVDF